jgi:hypothetical protein
MTYADAPLARFPIELLRTRTVAPIRANALALRRPIVPLVIVLHLFRLGLLAALIFAVSADTQQFEASRDCRGSFSRDFFSKDFDRYRCDLVVKKIGSDFKIRVPLPQ